MTDDAVTGFPEFLDAFRDLSDAERLDEAEKAALLIGKVLDAAESREFPRVPRNLDFLGGVTAALLAVTEGRRSV